VVVFELEERRIHFFSLFPNPDRPHHGGLRHDTGWSFQTHACWVFILHAIGIGIADFGQ